MGNASDSWLRINAGKAFTSGVYFGSSDVRTDGTLQVGSSGAYLNVNSSKAEIKVPTTITKAVNITGATSITGDTTITGDANISGTIISQDAIIDDAIITGDLRVDGVLESNEMRTNIVQAVGGQIYVAPTFVATSNSTIICSSCETNKVNFTISDSNAITQLTYGGANWYNGSKIKFTGKITSNKITDNPPIIAFNSADGTLTSNMNASSGKLTISVNYDGIGTYFTNSANNLTYSDMSVMMYQIRNNNVDYPVGIYIKSYGSDNKNSYIDVYGGTTTAPNVRLGLLNGLKDPDNPTQDLTIDGDIVRGWGLMTNSGYFKGKIISHSGKIGGWTLGQTTLSSGTLGANNSMWLSTDAVTATKFAGAASALTTWRIAAGSNFGVTSDGTLYASNLKASGGTIGCWTIGTSSLYSGSHSAYNSNNDGIFMDSTYLAGGKQAAWYLKNDGSAKIGAMTLTAAGVLSVPAANISGELSASQIAVDAIKSRTYTYSSGNFSTAGIQFNLTGNGYIRSKNFAIDSSGNAYFSAGYFGGTSGFTVAAGKMYSGTKSTLTSNTVNGVYVGTDGIALGQGKFKVTNEGVLDATSGSIGGWDITQDDLSSSWQDGSISYLTSLAPDKFLITSDNNGDEAGVSIDYSGINMYTRGEEYDRWMTLNPNYLEISDSDGLGEIKVTYSSSRYSSIKYDEIIENGTPLRNKYLKLSGGTLTDTLYGTDGWMKKSSGEIDLGCYHSGLGDLKLYQVISSAGSHGLYSNGYWNGSKFVSGGRWLISRTTGNNNLMEGDTYLTGNFHAQSSTANTARVIRVTHNSFGGTDIDMEVGSSGIAGIWSNKYWNGSAAVSSGVWLLNRGTDGLLRVRNYEGTMSYPLVSMSSNAGNRIGGMSCGSATSMNIRGDWGSTTTPKYMSVTVTSSDPKLKNDIRPSTIDALDIIDAIPLHSFNWNDSGDHWCVGFIAPELYEIDKNLARKPENEEDGYWSVNDFYLSGLQTKAIQELSAENNELRNKITSLEARIASLEALIK